MINLEMSTTRRAVFGISAGAVAVAATIAMPVPASAPDAWSPGNWLVRWGRLGCGARLDGHRQLQLTPRAGQEGTAAIMLGELATLGRTEAIIALLENVYDEDEAVRAVRQCRELDLEFVSEDVDKSGHDAWMARSCAAEERLLLVPASTGKGLADKLRIGLEMNGSELGERIVAHVLGQLERMA